MSGLTAAARAAGLVTVARKRLAHSHPFHAALVSAWRVGPSDETATVAVTVRGGAVALLYHPEFVTRCRPDELANVLLHEVHHVLFGHLFADPARFPDRRARVIAEEVTANEWIPGPLPGRPITLADHPALPPDEDTDTRYRRLTGGASRPKPRPGVPNPAAGAPKTAAGVPNSPAPAPEPGSPGQHGQPVPAGGGGEPAPLDDHGLWAEARAAAVAGRMAVRAAVEQAWRGLTPAERQKVPVAVRRLADSAGRGDRPGEAVDQVGPAPQAGRVDWRAALRRFVRQAVPQPSLQRPPRRFPALAGVVPGRAYRPGRARVMAVIDTSGSVGGSTLAAVAAELGRMRRACDVTVVECDAAVRAVYRLGAALGAVRGRGGTDLRPPFQEPLLRRVRPDVVVYFTDGFGPAPGRPPPVPVVWCLTPGGAPPVPWGQAIRMEAGGGT